MEVRQDANEGHPIKGMGNLKLNVRDKDGRELEARKLDQDDPEVARAVAQSLEDQESARKRKPDWEEMRKVITV